MKVICVIPARYKSSRFPGKPLEDICGKPMIWWVYQQAEKVKRINEIYIATDDSRIEKVCHNLNMNVIITSDKHRTGTDRVGEVARKIKADLYVNVQGDEPLIQPETIEEAIRPFEKINNNIEVTNCMTEIKEMADLIDTTVPKVVVNKQNKAIFLSRLPIPYPKSRKGLKYYKQVCVYVFTPEALEKFCILSEKGPAEEAEDIELLRFIENDINVVMVEVEQDTIGVDTPNDLEMARQVIEEQIGVKK